MTEIDKKQLSEQDICSKFILPAILEAGWNLQTQIREQVTFTAGRMAISEAGLLPLFGFLSRPKFWTPRNLPQPLLPL